MALVETTDELIARLADDLADYQSQGYAQRFLKLVDRARQAEQRVASDSVALTEAVARFGHKLMAYKDEYEVARLLLLPEMQAAYEEVGGATTTVTWRLHPPMLRALGLDRKIEMGPRYRPVMKALRRGKRLRGTVADPFRWANVRRVERAMIPEYEKAVTALADRLSAAQPRRGRRHRLPPRPGPRLRRHQAPPRRTPTAPS